MSSDFIEDSFLFTGLTRRTKAFLEDNQEQLLKVFELAAGKNITIQMDIVRGVIRGGMQQQDLEV